jgi:hypothetical protein
MTPEVTKTVLNKIILNVWIENGPIWTNIWPRDRASISVQHLRIVYIPYPIQESGKRIFFDPFLSGICWRIYILILGIYTFLDPILYSFCSTNLNFAAVFSFAKCSFCLHLLWGEIVNRYLQKKLCTFVTDSCSVHSSLFSRKVVYWIFSK